MSDLVENPEDRFSHNEAHFEPCQENLSAGFSTREDANQSALLQRLFRILNFRINRNSRYYGIRHQTTKLLIRLHGCAGCYTSFLFPFCQNRFTHHELYSTHLSLWWFKWHLISFIRYVKPIELCHENTNILVSDRVPHKPGCTATEDG